jgi:predicted RNA-binding Zn-ribbon protein involved in translation (DUF1610 family)
MSKNRTIQCNSCGVHLHVGDQYNEDGCPCCGGEIRDEQEVERLEDIRDYIDSEIKF